MVKVFFVIIMFSVCLSAFSQADTNKILSIVARVYNDNTFNSTFTEVDTSLNYFQIYSPLSKYATSFSDLGNYGSPAVSNIFFNRHTYSEFIFINPIIRSFESPYNVKYYTTPRPFTLLTYIEGGSSSSKEEILEVLHTQNVNSRLNFGFKMNFLASLGHYRYQKVKKNSFKIFSDYKGNVYSYHGNININKYDIEENGGIEHDYYITNPDSLIDDANVIPTNFKAEGTRPRLKPDVENNFRNFHAYFAHKINIGNLFIKKDTSNNKIPREVLTFFHVFQYEQNKRMYIDLQPQEHFDSNFIDNIYINRNNTFDSICFKKITNSFRIRLKDFIQAKFNYDLFVDFTSDIYINSSYTDDSIITEYSYNNKEYDAFFYKEKFFNNSIKAGLSTSIKERIGWEFGGKYYITGYRFGSFVLNGNLFFVPTKSKNSKIDISGEISSMAVNYYYQKYYSNHFYWNNNFIPERKVELSTKFSHLPKNLQLYFNYALLRNKIYFNEDALPDQLSRTLMIVAFGAEKRFKLWKFRSLNKITLQYVNDEKILSIPNVVAFSSTYFEQEIRFRSTGGKLNTMLGFDLYFFTAHNAYAYMPALSSFYQQTEKQLGNYPYLDVFLNIRLKRGRFFLKYEHINSNWLNRNYFTILHYPKAPGTFKFGISWTVYN